MFRYLWHINHEGKIIFFSHDGLSDRMNVYYIVKNDIRCRRICPIVLPKLKWTHIAVTKWHKEVRFYINGIVKSI